MGHKYYYHQNDYFQIECVKSKILKKFTTRTLKRPIYDDSHSYKTPVKNDSKHFQDTHDRIFKVESFKSAFNLTKIDEKYNISKKVDGAKKKLLKIIHLNDCFEEEQVRDLLG